MGMVAKVTMVATMGVVRRDITTVAMLIMVAKGTLLQHFGYIVGRPTDHTTNGVLCAAQCLR